MKSKQISISLNNDLHEKLVTMAQSSGLRSLSSYLAMVLYAHAHQSNVDTGKVPETALPNAAELFKGSAK